MEFTEPKRLVENTFPKTYEAALKALESRKKQRTIPLAERIRMNQRLYELSLRARNKRSGA